MTGEEILRELDKRGVKARTESGTLVLRPAQRCQDIWGEIIRHREEICAAVFCRENSLDESTAPLAKAYFQAEPIRPIKIAA